MRACALMGLAVVGIELLGCWKRDAKALMRLRSLMAASP
jgi:hypothetical protein